MQNKKLTGYPHIDKPWMKFYSEEQLTPTMYDCNIVEYLKIKNSSNMNNIAEIFYKEKYTYKKLFEKVEVAARVLYNVGIRKGEVIASFIPNIPQAGWLWLGATEIGAITDFIDPRMDSPNPETNAQKLKEIFIREDVKHIIALDSIYISTIKPIEKDLKKLGIKSIIIVDMMENLSLASKIDCLIDKIQYTRLSSRRTDNKKVIPILKELKKQIKSRLDFKYIIKKSIEDTYIKTYKYCNLEKNFKTNSYEKINDGNLINYIGHTSGTTSAFPKPISFNSINAIALIEQCEKGGFSPQKGEKTFHLLPFFAPAGAYSNYIANLGTGSTTIDIDEFYIADFGYLINKYKPNYVLATPAWFNSLPTYNLLQGKKLHYLHKLIYVGDSMTNKQAMIISEWLKKNESEAVLESAHGMSELGGCGSYATGNANIFGSIGIPLPDTIYAIIDPDIKDRLVPINFGNKETISGELAISAPNLTIGIVNNNTVVPKYILDGKVYIRTKDLVEMNTDGVIFFKERIDRSFVRYDGYKYRPAEIENIINENKYVKQSIITPYYEKRIDGVLPRCNIVLDKQYIVADYKDIVEDIIHNTLLKNTNISIRQLPTNFKFVKEFPLTKNNKIDFNKLTNEDLQSGEVNVIVEETNLSVGKIEIY